MNHVWVAAVRHGDALHVLASRDGRFDGMRPLGVFTPDWSAVHEAGEAVRQRVRHAADVGRFDVDAQREIRLHGSFLFDELLPFELKTWLRDDNGLLTLSLSPDLLDVPWELLHTGHDVLSHAWAIGRVIQQPVDHRQTRGMATNPRMLIVADPDGELDESYAEGVLLQRTLRDGADVTLRAADVPASFVRRHARAYDILHFAGHIDARGWRMSESWLSPDDVERLVGGGALPRLLFVNGCGATRTNSGGALATWLRGGVEHVLGPLYDVPDRLGRDFAARCYQYLMGGMPIGEAVRRARLDLAQDLGDGATPWGSYVLYGDPGASYAPSEVAPHDDVTRPMERPTLLAPREDQGRPEVVRSAMASPQPGTAASTGPTTTLRQDWIRFSVVLALILLVTIVASAWISGVGSSQVDFDDSPFEHPAG